MKPEQPDPFYRDYLVIVYNMFFIRKLGESEAQCNTLREEIQQLRAEMEQLKAGGRTAGMLVFD